MAARYASRAGLPGSSAADRPSRQSLETLPVLSPPQLTRRPGGDLLSDAEATGAKWAAHQQLEPSIAKASSTNSRPQSPRWGQAVVPARLEGGQMKRPASASASEYHQRVGFSAPVHVDHDRVKGRVLAARGEIQPQCDSIAAGQRMELSDDDLVEPQLASIAAAIAGNRSLIFLDLSGAGRATQHTTSVLLLALEEHPCLAHLDVHGLPVHPRNLSDFMRRNEHLESLDLYGCYDAREVLTDGCWVALRHDLHEHGDLVARKGDIVCLRRGKADVGSATDWRVHGAPVPATQLRRACYSAAGSLALLAAGLRGNRGLLHVNLAVDSACAASLAPAILAHPKLVSFNALPLRAPTNASLASESDPRDAVFALTVAHLAGSTEMSLLVERWLAPPVGQAPILRVQPTGSTAVRGAAPSNVYSYAALVELRLDGAGGGLDSSAMQLLFQGLTRQGKRDGRGNEEDNGSGRGLAGGSAATQLQTLVVDGAIVPAESVACVLRSHRGLRTLELSGVTDSPYAAGMPHPADLAAVLRSLAQTPDGNDQGTPGLWLKEVGVCQRLQQLRYVRRVNSLADYSNHPGLDGKPPPHPQRRPPRRVWLAEAAQQSRRPSPTISRPYLETSAENAAQQLQGPLPRQLGSNDGVAVVTLHPDPEEGLGLVLEDEFETNNAFVKELLDTSQGLPGAAERAGLALGAVVLGVDDHSVLGLGCVAVAAKVRVARAAGRDITFTVGTGEDARLGRLRAAAAESATAAGDAQHSTNAEGCYVALTQSVRDGPLGLDRRPAKKSVAFAVEDLQPAGYSGQRALSVLSAALLENTSLTALSLTVNPSMVAPRTATLLDGPGRRRRRERQNRGAPTTGKQVDDTNVNDAVAWKTHLASVAFDTQAISDGHPADTPAGLSQWALSWSDVIEWAKAVAANVRRVSGDSENDQGGGSLRLYNGLDVTALRNDTLMDLDLRRRLLGGDGALLLAEFLPDMVQLRRLVLSECALPVVGTAAIIETLRAPRKDEQAALDACATRVQMLESRLERLNQAAMRREEEAQRNRGSKLAESVITAWPERARHDVLWPETSVVDLAAVPQPVTQDPAEQIPTTSDGLSDSDTTSPELAALLYDDPKRGEASFAERSDLAVDGLAAKAAARRKAKTLARRASDECQAVPARWDSALALIKEAGSLDPDSEDIAEEDAVITRLALLAMDPSHHTHTGGLGRYNRSLRELDLRGCTVDANQLNRLLAWRTKHAKRYDHRQAPRVNIMFEARWLLGPLVQAETMAARSQSFAHQSAMAIRIQTAARGWAARACSRRKAQHARQDAAAKYIQGWLHAVLHVRRVRQAAKAKRRQAAAVLVQRWWRGISGRRVFRAVRAAWQAALREEALSAATGGIETVFETAWQKIAHRELWSITGNIEPQQIDVLLMDPKQIGKTDANQLLAAAVTLCQGLVLVVLILAYLGRALVLLCRMVAYV
eukprot:COSAG02_NODE_1574_length_11880_cov_13.431675_9_plen_1461_part_00